MRCFILFASKLLSPLLLVALFVALSTTSAVGEARIAYDPSASSLRANANLYKGKTSLAHLTFASGNRQSSDQVFWEDIVSKVLLSQPDRFTASAKEKTAAHGQEEEERRQSHKKGSDMLLWLGNAVYTDISEAGVELVKPRTPAEIEKQYRVLSQNTYYQSFLERFVANQNVVGVWDEHDMGLRHGADKNYSQARDIRDIYLKHIMHNRKDIKDQLAHNEYNRGKRDENGEGEKSGGGLYHFTRIPAPVGSALADVYKNAVCVIALDVVSLRDPYPDFTDSLLKPFPVTSSQYLQARKVKELPQADLLGEPQWIWLEDIIQRYVAPHDDDNNNGGNVEKEECALTVFASAWQVLLNDNKPFTGWDLYPASRTRLLALLKNYEVSRFIFLTGHAELGEIGGIIAASNADVERKASASILGIYAKHFPLTPLTKYSRELLPFTTSSTEALDSQRKRRKARKTRNDEKGWNNKDAVKRDGAEEEESHHLSEEMFSQHANGLVEATSSGLTHSLSSAPFVGRLASWLVDGDATSNTMPYLPDDVMRQERARSLEEDARTGYRFMSRYLVVGHEVKPRRNIGTLQLLTTLAAAKGFATSATASVVAGDEAYVKDVNEDDDPRLAGYGNGPAAARAFVDEAVKIAVVIYATDDGSALLTYEASLAQLPSYRRKGRKGAVGKDDAVTEGGARKGKEHFVDYRETPPFSVFNLPGEFPSIKRSILSRGCAEVPCVHGKLFMIVKTVFILIIAFIVLMVFAAVIIAVLMAVERRREKAEEKLKVD